MGPETAAGTRAFWHQNVAAAGGPRDPTRLATMDAALLPVKADYYLCGPMPFMAEQQKALVARGIPAENIHSEAFGTGGVHH